MEIMYGDIVVMILFLKSLIQWWCDGDIYWLWLSGDSLKIGMMEGYCSYNIIVVSWGSDSSSGNVLVMLWQ